MARSSIEKLLPIPPYVGVGSVFVHDGKEMSSNSENTSSLRNKRPDLDEYVHSRVAHRISDIYTDGVIGEKVMP